MERRNAQASLINHLSQSLTHSLTHSRSNSAKSISRRMLPIDHDMQRPPISVSQVGLLWVNRVVLTARRSLPVYPDERTYSEPVRMSQRCH